MSVPDEPRWLRRLLRGPRRRAPVLGKRWRRLLRRIGLIRLDERPLPAGDEILGFLVTRDNLAMTRHAIEWHRRIGVERFFVTDNGSEDGTLDWLLAQDDVHVFETHSNFHDTGFGPGWHQAMLDAYGEGHWCIVFDDDEWFVWPGMEDVPLRAFLDHLDAAGAEVVEAVMIDMYARIPIKDAETETGESLLEIFPWYDPGPYHRRRRPSDRRFPRVLFSGGVRGRVFHGTPERPVLSKVPLVKWRRGMKRASCHTMDAGWRTVPLTVGLLHFRHTADFARRSEQYIAWQADWAGSAQSHSYLDGLDREPDLTLWSEGSHRFRDTARFVEDDLLRIDEAYAALWRTHRDGG